MHLKSHAKLVIFMGYIPVAHGWIFAHPHPYLPETCLVCRILQLILWICIILMILLNLQQRGHHIIVLKLMCICKPLWTIWIMPIHSCSVNNLKNFKKLSENQNLIEMTHFFIVLCMPDHHPILSGLFGCPQMVPKVSHAAGKMVEKSK